MRAGIYLDGRNPEAWAKPWPDFYSDQIELVIEAERLGADSVWLSEHHLFDDGYLPQPLTFAAALAAVTDRIRLGTAVLLAPLWNPARLAEEIAVVDNLSNGRLTIGLGAGYSAPEFELYGSPTARRYGRTDELVRELRRLLGPGGPITPPALQQPPEVWLGYQGPQGARRAGLLGAPLLSLNPSSLAPYREALSEAGHGADAARMAGVVTVVVADDPDDAFERVLPHALHQINTYREAAAAGTGRTPSPVTAEKLRTARHEHTGVVSPLEVMTSDRTIEWLRGRVADLPVEEVFCWASVAGMPDELVQRHLELWLGEVRPAIADW
ncbi:MAG: LLM class flavin-dependent oxidoreductase [Acidimicrobiales bacterium]